MNYALSDVDVKKIAPDCRVFSYSQLTPMTNLNQLINTTNRKAMILYQTGNANGGASMGHWVSIMLLNNGIYFFDSYGTFPDKEQNMIGQAFMEQSNQTKNKLQSLIRNSPYANNAYYSEYKYQAMKPGVNTCGRWSALFLRCDMTENEYHNFIMKAKKSLNTTNDKTIVILTNPFL
jgi:hypothetical protein